MATLFDYLKDYEKSPFNHLDALVFSIIAYLPFDGLVSVNPLAKTRLGDIELVCDDPNLKQELQLFNTLKASSHFAEFALSGFVNEVDEKLDKQFSALLVDTKDNHLFIAFRGTDASLIGWKEDLKMSFMLAVPSQIRSVSYIEKIASIYPSPLRLGGHSKGGNLAIYAASFCAPSAQKRIVSVYNNDGPGLSEALSLKPSHINIKPRIQTYVPQSSVVGMLFSHPSDYRIVYSKEIGILQHDPFSWMVEKKDFVYFPQLTSNSQFVDKTLKKWINDLEPWQKEKVTTTLFDLFAKSNIKNFNDLKKNWYPNVIFLAKSLASLDNPSKKLLLQTLRSLLNAAKSNVRGVN